MRRTPRTLAVGVALVVAALGGCTDDEPEVPEVPATTTPAEPSNTTTSPTATPAPTSTVGVPELCSDLIRTGRVAQIVQTPMPSGVRRIYNDDFLESSGRTGRLTCEYGIGRDQSPPASPSPDDDAEAAAKLEIAVSGYTGADVAAGRIGMTVDNASGQVEAQSVAGRDGFLLRDNEDVSLVFADGKNTYVITIVRGFVPEPAEPVVLLSIGREILGESSEDDAS